jgi:hypothetical protein
MASFWSNREVRVGGLLDCLIVRDTLRFRMLMGNDRIHAIAHPGLLPKGSYPRVRILAKEIGVEDAAVDVEAAKGIVGPAPDPLRIKGSTDTSLSVLDGSNLVFGDAQFAHAALDTGFHDILPHSGELDSMLGRIGWDDGASGGWRPDHRWRPLASEVPCQRL